MGSKAGASAAQNVIDGLQVLARESVSEAPLSCCMVSAMRLPSLGAGTFWQGWSTQAASGRATASGSWALEGASSATAPSGRRAETSALPTLAGSSTVSPETTAKLGTSPLPLGLGLIAKTDAVVITRHSVRPSGLSPFACTRQGIHRLANADQAKPLVARQSCRYWRNSMPISGSSEQLKV